MVVMCGEGSQDVGKRDYQTDHWIDGPAAALFKVALDHSHNRACNITGINKYELDKEISVQKGVLKIVKGHGIKAYRLARYALLKRITFAVCYVDCDRRDFDDLHREFQKGFESVTSVKGIPMIPKTMIECWLLADEHAYQKLFKRKPQNPALPSKPEDLRGAKSEPESNYPKHVLRRVISQFHQVPDEYRLLLAELSDPDVLKSHCPISYERFYQDILVFFTAT